MKQKLVLSTRVLPVPNRENVFMVQWQFTANGPIFTRDNHGCGYTLEMAQQIARFAEENPEVVKRNEERK